MKFSYYDLGHLSKGQVVEVCLSAAANVRLLDSSNYSNYKNGRRHRYYGGYVKKSPYRIIVPNSGHWYITIDLGGYSGTVKHSVQVLPGVLPAARIRIPLANEPNLYVEAPEANKDYDVFISHASEDKEAVVRPLANALKEKDYITNPKKSGYSSYHMILEVPIILSQKIMYVKLEVQIRTMAMDFWASLEHKLKYKPQAEITKSASKELVSYAKMVHKLDNKMMFLSE